jgi:hypothetical protein
MEPDQVREPVIIAFSRLRLAWAELWMDVAFAILDWAVRVKLEEGRRIREWNESLTH